MISVGEQAPDFSLSAQNGEQVSLSKYREQKAVVLYFYPKDETPGCTAEACYFRDAYEDFTNAGAVVIGVSSDSLESHRSFAENHHLPFLLVSDADGALRKKYGVSKTLGLLPGRVTFVIGKDGKVLQAFSSQINMKKHVDEALQALQQAPT